MYGVGDDSRGVAGGRVGVIREHEWVWQGEESDGGCEPLSQICVGFCSEVC